MSNHRPSKTNKWMRIGLAVSLALNLLVVGLVAGVVLSGGWHKRSADQSLRGLPFGPYGRALSQEDRAAIRQAFEARRSEFQDSRRQMRGFAEEIAQAVQADPFDPDQLSAILERQRGLQTELTAKGQSLFVDQLSAMSQAERAEFSDRLSGVMKRGRLNR